MKNGKSLTDRQTDRQTDRGEVRRSSIELLKVIAIFLIVVSHVTQSVGVHGIFKEKSHRIFKVLCYNKT